MVKRFNVLWLVLSFVLTAGCTPQTEKKDVFYVMFEKKPALFDQTVYFKGSEIGRIISQQFGNLTITRLTIEIKSEHMEMMTSNAVFYTSGGKLNYATIENYGAPLPPLSKVLGFSSKGSIYWFKAKNLLNRSSDAALIRAIELYKIIGP